MIFLLDTDTIVYWLNGNKNISSEILSVGFNNIAASVVTKAELYYGAYKSLNIEKNLQTIFNVSQKVEFLPFNELSQANFGKLKVKLEKNGDGSDIYYNDN